MPTAAWRYVLCLGALFVLLMALGDAFDRGRFGSLGVTFQPVSEREAIVTDVLQGSDAARQGVKRGDRIAGDWLRPAAVLGLVPGPGVRVGTPVTFYDATEHRSVTVRASPVGLFTTSRITSHVLRILSFLLALLLFWRLPDDRAARALAAFLILENLIGWRNTGSFAFGTWFATFLATVAEPSALLMLVLFACWFPERHPQDIRRLISIAAVVFTGLTVTLGLNSVVYAAVGRGPHYSLPPFPAPIWIPYTVFAVLIGATLAVDFRAASQLDRRRLEWLTAGMILVAYSLVALRLFQSLFFTFGGSYTNIGLIISNVTSIAGIICFVYALLRYRVLDITLAISRATVFAILSTAIVGFFVAVEYLVGRYVEAQSHFTSAVILLGTALAIGISLRVLHRRVERFADRMIFGSRHQAEAGLHNFGRQVAFVTDEKILRERTVRELSERAGAQSAVLYLVTDQGEFVSKAACGLETVEGISADDPIILALKDRRMPLFPESHSSSVGGELALPMFVRGELTGLVICGKRRIRETYTPDEIDAMNYVVEHVGIQLDALRTSRLQIQLREVRELVRAYQQFGADGSRVLARIAEVSEVTDAGSMSTPPFAGRGITQAPRRAQAGEKYQLD